MIWIFIVFTGVLFIQVEKQKKNFSHSTKMVITHLPVVVAVEYGVVFAKRNENEIKFQCQIFVDFFVLLSQFNRLECQCEGKLLLFSYL